MIATSTRYDGNDYASGTGTELEYADLYCEALLLEPEIEHEDIAENQSFDILIMNPIFLKMRNLNRYIRPTSGVPP